MNARIERDVLSQQFKIWLYTRAGGDVMILRLRDRLAHDWERLPATADPGPPSLTLPEDALRAIMEEATDYLPPSAATDRHLTDALAVRDRTLALVERIVDADIAREARP